MTTPLASRSIAAAVATVLLACGTGGAGKALRPDDPSYAAATGEQAAAICHKVDAEGTPLVVDWKPEDRGDLEVAMKQGVAIVHYDCDTVKVLPDCHFAGSYGFIGITRSEQVISLVDADEAKANLPFSGGKIGASMARGSSLDIALVMVGKSMASALKVEQGKLEGTCDGATHFLRSATVGAFAMKTRTSGQVGAAAELFGAGASGASSSDKGVDRKVGDLAACRQADADAPSAPKECGAPLRVQLVALGHGLDPKSPPSEVSCPQGTVALAGKCAPVKPDSPHECVSDDVADCTKQCDAGNVTSCRSLALTALLKGLNAGNDSFDAAVVHAYEHGCELGDGFSCGALGEAYDDGSLGPKHHGKALALYAKGCGIGDGIGCRHLAALAASVDKGKAARLYARGCAAADAESCTAIGAIREQGDGVAQDEVGAKRDYQRACKLGDPKGCAKGK